MQFLVSWFFGNQYDFKQIVVGIYTCRYKLVVVD